MYTRQIILLISLAILFSCARIVQPPGGPADKTAPKAKSCTPENYSINFYNNKIVIDFDEYIVLKNFNQEFVSSPLFNENPKKILSGKSLTLKFDKDSLKENTTYTLDFGQSIVDFRAGNVLNNYQYVFSTGDVIDSLYISGHVHFAKDLSPQEDVWVMLYKNNNDSILRSQKPDFIAKTNDKGYYKINNIAAGSYSVFALKDINKNYIFDLPNEQIAFLDSVIIVKIEKITAEGILDIKRNIDSLNLEKDTLESIIDTSSSLSFNFNGDTLSLKDLPISNDSIRKLEERFLDKKDEPLDSIYSNGLDSIEKEIEHNSNLIAQKYQIFPEHVDLTLFEENFSNLYISEFERKSKYLLEIIFSQPHDSLFNIQIKNASKKQWEIESSTQKDTFSIWLSDTALAHTDTIVMFLDYYKTDTMLNLSASKDTLKFIYKHKRAKYKPKKKREKEEETDSIPIKINYLSISGNFTKSTFDVFRKPSIKVSFPLDTFDLSKILFYEKVDTNFIAQTVNIFKDSLTHRQFIIDADLKEETEYKLYIEPKAFVDYRNWANDTLEQVFRTTNLEAYTEINLVLENITEQVIVQLLDKTDNLIREDVISTDSTLIYINLSPGEYKAKIIVDRNKNSIWDTGNYDLKIQAEEIINYHEKMPTKAGWIHEFIWDFKESESH